MGVCTHIINFEFLPYQIICVTCDSNGKQENKNGYLKNTNNNTKGPEHSHLITNEKYIRGIFMSS